MLSAIIVAVSLLSRRRYVVTDEVRTMRLRSDLKTNKIQQLSRCSSRKQVMVKLSAEEKMRSQVVRQSY